MKILFYHNYENGRGMLLEWSEDLDGLVEAYGTDVMGWSKDFGLFKQDHGLWLWEGTIEPVSGMFRKLNQQEFETLMNHGQLLS